MPHKKTKKTVIEKAQTGTTAPDSEVRHHRHVDDYSEVMRNEPVCDNVLAAYMPKPSKLFIDILAENEHIILVLRQHPITQLRLVFAVMIMAALPLLFTTTDIFNFLPATYRFAAGFGWYLLTAGFALESFLNWFFRVFIITDERVIDVDFISMVHKNVSTTKIDKIEDVTSINVGFFSSLVDYGTVIIQTAATKQELHFESVPHPSRVTSLLNDLILEEELEKIEGRVS